MRSARSIFAFFSPGAAVGGWRFAGYLVLAGLLAGLGCSSSSEDSTTSTGTSTSVPSGLSFLCTSATDGGALTVNGSSVSGSVAQGTCVIYSFSAASGEEYVVTLSPSSGDADLFVAEDSSFSFTVGSSINFSTDTDTVDYVASTTGTHYVAVHGFQSSNYAVSVTGTSDNGDGSGQQSGTVTGTVVDAVTGQPLGGVSAFVVGVTSTTTDSAGEFSISGNGVAGSITLVFSQSGYISYNLPFAAAQGQTVDVGVVALSQTLAADDQLRIVLTWPENTDLDLFVHTPSGELIYYGNTAGSGISFAPGDSGGYGPETVSITTPETGLYTIYVRDISPTTSPLDLSNARVDVYGRDFSVSSRLKQVVAEDDPDVSAATYWHVAGIYSGSVNEVDDFVDAAPSPTVGTDLQIELIAVMRDADLGTAIRYRVTNIGTQAPDSSFYVGVYADESSAPVASQSPDQSVFYSTLNPGISLLAAVTINSPPGSGTAYVYADYQESVTDADTSNNLNSGLAWGTSGSALASFDFEDTSMPSEITLYNTASDSSLNWDVASDQAAVNLQSAKSGPIDDSSYTCMDYAPSSQVGRLSFYRMTSTEGSFDFLRFYLDTEVTSPSLDDNLIYWSGSTSWGLFEMWLPTDDHSFQWCYLKDISATSGSDAVWVDVVEVE